VFFHYFQQLALLGNFQQSPGVTHQDGIGHARRMQIAVQQPEGAWHSFDGKHVLHR
jgi:hypothetical protein